MLCLIQKHSCASQQYGCTCSFSVFALCVLVVLQNVLTLSRISPPRQQRQRWRRRGDSERQCAGPLLFRHSGYASPSVRQTVHLCPLGFVSCRQRGHSLSTPRTRPDTHSQVLVRARVGECSNKRLRPQYCADVHRTVALACDVCSYHDYKYVCRYNFYCTCRISIRINRDIVIYTLRRSHYKCRRRFVPAYGA